MLQYIYTLYYWYAVVRFYFMSLLLDPDTKVVFLNIDRLQYTSPLPHFFIHILLGSFKDYFPLIHGFVVL